MGGIPASMGVLGLFVLAGVLAGGLWSTYQRGLRVPTAVLALATALALAFAIMAMMEVM
ncbi:hypothetical protein [Corynebacterium pseudogenitalium]|uniref:Uncharacterized protein n=1 Tax=Corynebacterium pseudogenitalium TaxID=38303 RepID=A0ABD4TRR3_9CORY|nr:hypothetical protein [Corynebacterium pseudogenitalium]MCQ4613451.1 hypothetical protein [Corynebacterium pseudogenitalium]